MSREEAQIISLNHSARQVLCHRGNYQQQENSQSRLLYKNLSEFICNQFCKYIHIYIILHIYIYTQSPHPLTYTVRVMFLCSLKKFLHKHKITCGSLSVKQLLPQTEQQKAKIDSSVFFSLWSLCLNTKS